MTRKETLLSTADTARLAGVAASSIKRWADEGLLPCSRTAGGHRRFLSSDVQRFLEVNESKRLESASLHAETWLSLLLSADQHSLLGALFSARGRLGAWFRVAEELGLALALLGDSWARGEISVLEEHLASDRLYRALSQVTLGFTSPSGDRTCLLAAAEGEEHLLGLALADLVLRENGWRTLWSGRATPARELVGALGKQEVAMVALSASVSAERRRLAAEARTLSAACRQRDIPLVLGGAGPWPGNVPGTIRIEDFRSFQRLLREGAGESS